MLNISIFELITRGVPEGFLFVLATYSFAKKKVVPLQYIISSIIVFTFTYSVRFININFGVHTILNLICLITVAYFINKIDVFTAVKGAMFAALTMFVLEAVNVFILQVIFRLDFEAVFKDPYKKAMAGVPGIIMFGIVIVLSYLYNTRKLAVRGEDGSISK